MTDSPPTPPPRPVLRDDEPSQQIRLGHECPYRGEIHALRRLLAYGAEEQAVLGRRRGTLGSWIAGVALAAALSAVAWVYTDGRNQASLNARRDVRIEMLESQAAGSAPAAAQLARVEQRLEGLEQRLGERLAGIEQRLDRAETAARPRDRR